MKEVFFETQRLLFRNWIESDRELLIQMNSDLRVMEFFPRTFTSEESSEWMSRMQLNIKNNGYGFYSVEEKDSSSWIGFIGINEVTFNSDFTPCMEVGWRLKKEFWGKGYATEGGKACISFALNQLSISDIYSFTAKINQRSENVMKKIGLKKVKEFGHPKIEKDHPLHLHVLYKTNVK
ncbi:MAG TPA: GNAT family N-acetyltransferase [Leptospiraceae bacterium]|nr:GNAT family N-acetyltransferase [Leptospiraceae bacterium]HNB99337.1 GNAT family N-acetyltransferase [Leptospiraceae bacterium]